MRVDLMLDGVTHVGDAADGPMWLRWKVGRKSGETKEATANRQGNVEWNEAVTLKTSFKPTNKGEGYDRKTCILTLKGKRNRTSFTLGTLTIDLSLYMRDTPTALHFGFEHGGKSLPNACEFKGKIRVVPWEGAKGEAIDVSSTMNDSDEDEDEEEKTRTADDSMNKPKKFLVTSEEIARKAPARGVVSPALQIQGYEEELKEARRRAVLERRDLEAKHQAEVVKLQQQLRLAQADAAAKVKALQEELQRAKDATSSTVVAQLRAQKDEAEDQSQEKTQIIQGLRDQLNDALARLTEQTSVSARTEANLQRLEKEVAALRTEKEEWRRKNPVERKDRRSQTLDRPKTPVLDLADLAKKADVQKAENGKKVSENASTGSRAVGGDDAAAVPATPGSERDHLSVSGRRSQHQHQPSGSARSGSGQLSALRNRPLIELPVAEGGGGTTVRALAVMILFIAFGFFIYKKVM